MTEDATATSSEDRLLGCLLGTAVGDAIGLPYENLSPRRRERLFGRVGKYQLVKGCGIGSDDTELTIHLARALLHSGGEVNAFEMAFARSLRAWILTLPAGVGKATAIACFKLLLGFPLKRAGHRSSAGNGPSMRAAIIGALYADDPERMRNLVRASSRLTHHNPDSETGAQLVALAAAHRGNATSFFPEAVRHADSPRWTSLLDKLSASLSRSQRTSEFAAGIGLERGVSGYVLHTVPVALHAAFSTDSVRDAVIAAVECGGDTDTVGAIAGAIAGARHGAQSIPPEWISQWRDFPITVEYMREIAARLHSLQNGGSAEAPAFPWPPALGRNALFFLVVLAHVIRRLLPPY